jgi:hypothetical protein
MKVLRKIAPLIFLTAVLFAIGTAGALELDNISMGQACIQWAMRLAVMWVILRAGRCV